MNFACQTTNCAIALSEASFPVAINCPVCQSPLVPLKETPALSEEEERLIAGLPYVVAYPLRRTLLEKHAWTKINLLKDTFLNYLKYLGLITASEFFNSPLKDRKMVALFQQALSEPSFGSWNQYMRETLQYLIHQGHDFFCKDLITYYETVETGKKRKLYKGEIEYLDGNGDVQLRKQEATGIGMLINFRNRYLGHGLTLDELAANKLWDEYFPIFRELLQQMTFAAAYPMFKQEHGEAYLLQSAEIRTVEKGLQQPARVWMENPNGANMDILPFFVVPAEMSISKDDKEQILTYESYTGKTIKFFSPEGTEKQTSGKILERLNLLLRDKQKEQPYTPETFTREIFLHRIADENKLILDALIAERKVIPGVYVHRPDMEIKLREWTGARTRVFFIAAEAGSGKTNLLVEMQRQYAENGLPSLLIRAGRMEKNTLRQQIAYLLNLDEAYETAAYTGLAGIQAAPTFILLDGLNEASNAEELWMELLNMSRMFEPGSLKFVITSRATTSLEVEHFTLSDADERLLYGENKDRKKGLSAYTHWLMALNMVEMKGAWEGYVQKDKSRFKPLFSFDDLATFDRALYNHLCNPLVLRLFLETYSGKALPKKGNKHLNIWADWLATFQNEELQLLKLLADSIWEKGENELLLDDLLKDEKLKSWFTTDKINAPYQRLKNNGWLSRYVKDLDVCVSFTVEGALFYLLGVRLSEQIPVPDLPAIITILNRKSKFRNTAVEAFLNTQALNGDLSLVDALIDTSDEFIDVCVNPLVLYLKSYGVKQAINEILKRPTENDWKVFIQLDSILCEFTLHGLRIEYLTVLMQYNTFQTKESIWLGLRALILFDHESVQRYLPLFSTPMIKFQDDIDLLNAFGDLLGKTSDYDGAMKFYQKCLEIEMKALGNDHPSVATTFSNIGLLWDNKGEYDLALEFYQKCIEIQAKALGSEHPSLATTFGNIGVVWDNKGEYDRALEFYHKSLDINMKALGNEHPSVAITFSNIGLVWDNKGNYDLALEFYQKCLEIQVKNLGIEYPSVAITLSNMGLAWKHKGEYDRALEFYQKCLEIEMKFLGSEHPSVATTYSNIGVIWNHKGEYDRALEFYQKCLEIEMKALGSEHLSLATTFGNIGLVWDNKGEYDCALQFYQKCVDIKMKALGSEHPSVATTLSNIGLAWKHKGEYDRALEFYQECLEIEMKALGRDHPSLATTFSNIGIVLYNKGEYDRALEFYNKSAKIQMKAMGNEHPSVATTFNNIGMVWDNKGEYDRALEFYLKSLDIKKKASGNMHPSLATTFGNIGVVYYNKGENDRALEFYQKCLDIQLQALGSEHPSLATAYSNIGTVLINQDEYDRALEFYQKCLAIQLTTFGQVHPELADTYMQIGICFENLKKYKLAIDSILLGYTINHAGGYPFRIASCLEKLGDKIKALRYYKESAEIRKEQLGLQDDKTLEAVHKSIELSREIDKQNELPEWMMDYD